MKTLTETTNIKVGMGAMNVMEIAAECEHGYTQTTWLEYNREGEQPSWEDVRLNGACMGGCPFGCHV
jgi:hypothetical protein